MSENPRKNFHPIGENTSLRLFTENDAEELFALVDQYRSFLKEWLPWLDENKRPSDSAAFIRSTLEQHSRGEGPTFAVIHDQKIIGVAGFLPPNPRNHSIEIGYWLSPQYTGKGIITGACRFLIDYAFENLKVNKVILAAAVENKKSRAVAERLGLVLEAIIRDGEWLYDHYVDLALYSLLARERI